MKQTGLLFQPLDVDGAWPVSDGFVDLRVSTGTTSRHEEGRKYEGKTEKSDHIDKFLGIVINKA